MKLRYLWVALVLLPLMVGAETIEWTLPTQYVDNTAISAADQARITVYLRGYKKGSTAKTYFGETRGGLTAWSDNVMVRMNYWGVENAVPGWVPIKAGDNVLVTVSAAIVWNGVEYDGPESAPYAWTIPGGPVTPPPPPPTTPSCKPPSGITIKQ
jgi:hypothetical protein